MARAFRIPPLKSGGLITTCYCVSRCGRGLSDLGVQHGWNGSDELGPLGYYNGIPGHTVTLSQAGGVPE